MSGDGSNDNIFDDLDNLNDFRLPADSYAPDSPTEGTLGAVGIDTSESWHTQGALGAVGIDSSESPHTEETLGAIGQETSESWQGMSAIVIPIIPHAPDTPAFEAWIWEQAWVAHWLSNEIPEETTKVLSKYFGKARSTDELVKLFGEVEHKFLLQETKDSIMQEWDQEAKRRVSEGATQQPWDAQAAEATKPLEEDDDDRNDIAYLNLVLPRKLEIEKEDKTEVQGQEEDPELDSTDHAYINDLLAEAMLLKTQSLVEKEVFTNLSGVLEALAASLKSLHETDWTTQGLRKSIQEERVKLGRGDDGGYKTLRSRWPGDFRSCKVSFDPEFSWSPLDCITYKPTDDEKLDIARTLDGRGEGSRVPAEWRDLSSPSLSHTDRVLMTGLG